MNIRESHRHGIEIVVIQNVNNSPVGGLCNELNFKPQENVEDGEETCCFGVKQGEEWDCTGAAGSRFPYTPAHRGVPQLSQCSHCSCTVQLLSLRSHGDSKLLITSLTPSKAQLSSPPSPSTADLASCPSCSPHHLTLVAQGSQRAKRNLGALWLEQSSEGARFLLYHPSRGLQEGPGLGLGGLLLSWSWQGLSPVPRSCPGSLCSTGPRALSRICRLGPLWRGLGVWEGRIEGFGRVWCVHQPGLICLSVWLVCVSRFSIPLQGTVTSVCLLL